MAGEEDNTNKKEEEVQTMAEIYADFVDQCETLPKEAVATTSESPEADEETTTTAAPAGEEKGVSDEQAQKEGPDENGSSEKWVKVQEKAGQSSRCKNGHFTSKFAKGTKNDWQFQDCAKLLPMHKGGECSDQWFSVSKEDGRCFCVDAGDKCTKRVSTSLVFGLYQKVTTDDNQRFQERRSGDVPAGADGQRPGDVSEMTPKQVEQQLKTETLGYLSKHPELANDFHIDEFLGSGAPARFAEVEVSATMESRIAAEAQVAIAANTQAWMDQQAALESMAVSMDMGEDESDGMEEKGADLTRREYIAPRLSNNSDITNLVAAIVSGKGDNPEYGIGDTYIKNLKNMSAEYALLLSTELEATFELVNKQTEDVYNYWLRDTCKKVKTVDELAVKKKKAVAVLKELNQKCNETVGNLRKQKVTKEVPIPATVGTNKVKFEFVNPPENKRQYSTGHSGNSQLDNGQGAKMGGYGQSAILDLGSQQRVRGLVVQGLPQNGEHLETYHVQYTSDGTHWTTVSDPGACSDTSGWNNKVPRVCHDTSGWSPTNWGWWGNRRYRQYYYGHWCVNGHIRYPSWRHVLRNHNNPVGNVCHCGKAADPDTCANYASNNWCKDGAVTWRRGESAMGPGHNWPEDNCAVCGKCAVDYIGGQGNNKVESLFPKPVDARWLRVILVKGVAAFRVAAITGRSVVDTTLTHPSFVAMVGFAYPHHPYNIQASDDGQTWKTVATDVITAKHTFAPPVHTGHIRLDWEEIGCNTFGGKPLTRALIEAMGFKLVRHTDGHVHGRTKASMHPARDQLRGTEDYGTQSSDYQANGDWSVKFDKAEFDEFLFTTGDLQDWLISAKDQVWGYYQNGQRTVKCSSTNPHTYKARWYRRQNKKQDPWIGLADHGTRPAMLYGGNSYAGWPTKAAKSHGGLNVFIRKGSAGASSQKEIDVSVIGYEKDPGDLLYPDSPVRVEACSEASTKEKAKEGTETTIEEMATSIAGDKQEVAKNADFLQTLNGIRARSSLLKGVYADAEADAKAWEETLLDDATPIAGHLRPLVDPRDGQPADATD